LATVEGTIEMQQAVPPSGELPGKITTKQFDLGVVTKIEASGPGTLVLARGVRGSVAVSAMPEDHERIEVKADGDTLKLGFKGGMLLHRGPEGDVRYEVTAAAIEEIKLSDGLVAEVVGLEAKEVKAKLGGGSRLTLGDLRATTFELEAGGGSRVVASGAVERQKAKLGGGSNYQGTALDSRVVEVDAAGGSEASVRVREQLKARASGGSTVSYVGEGVSLDVKTDGGSKLRHVTGV
jgi:hypothetical protein